MPAGQSEAGSSDGKDQAGSGAGGIDLALGIDDAAFGGADAAADLDDFAFRIDGTDLVGDRAQQADLVFQRGVARALGPRSEERSVGKECVSTFRSRWSQDT